MVFFKGYGINEGQEAVIHYFYADNYGLHPYQEMENNIKEIHKEDAIEKIISPFMKVCSAPAPPYTHSEVFIVVNN